ncbi:hypothetical protein FTO74_15315 [Granulicella sp. WH15]|nr:hypothetical protein FTO74_15315 [Granulicella sp. WH15]
MALQHRPAHQLAAHHVHGQGQAVHLHHGQLGRLLLRAPRGRESGEVMKKIARPSVILLAFTLATAHAQAQARYQITDEDANGPGSPRVVVLHDNTAKAEAAVAPSQGGELSSYKITFQGKPLELLYHARDYTSPGFQGKAPLLWPAAGVQYPVGTIPKESCGNGTYPVAGKTFPMPCHGFARTLPWKEISRSADAQGARVTVELTDSDKTRLDYPFGFKVDLTYELSGGLLTLNYTISADAENKGPMPFSIGNHIAFRVPLVEGSDPAAMTFESPNTTQLMRYPGGVGLNGEEKPSSYAIPQRMGDFDAHIALPLSGYRSMPYARLVDPAGLSVRITQTASIDPTNTELAIPNLSGQLIRFNVYGGPHEGYLSPEPWFGLINSLNSRKGFIDLAPGGSWRWRIQVAPLAPLRPCRRPAPGSSASAVTSATSKAPSGARTAA